MGSEGCGDTLASSEESGDAARRLPKAEAAELD